MTLVCPECFDNRTFKRRLEEVRPTLGRGKCDYHPTRKGIPLDAVASIVDEVFRNNFASSAEDGDRSAEELAEALLRLTGAGEEEVSEAMAAELIENEYQWSEDNEPPFYSETCRYEQVKLRDQVHGALWRRFRESIMYGRRFFNDDAAKVLKEIFRDIHLQRDTARVSPVYMLETKPARLIYRARIATDEQVAEIAGNPVNQLGPAPRAKRKAGRMNVSGIPAFYGSFDLKTCVAELRPSVGSTIVSGQFTLARPLCVLDVTRFSKRPKQLDMFAKDHVRRLTQWRFMQRFRREIARPVSPSGEHLDYVPTQVVAEYLNTVHEVRLGSDKRHIDAIIFNSAQNPDGRNIVILGDAAVVMSPKATKRRRTSAGLSEPSLGLDLREEPAEPGLLMVDDSIRVAKVGGASFTLEGGQSITEYLDPGF